MLGLSATKDETFISHDFCIETSPRFLRAAS
jgi:hypothetical protein